jgi:gluconate 2-dehydrogenase gamma chain
VDRRNFLSSFVVGATLPSFLYGLSGCKPSIQSRVANAPGAASELGDTELEFVRVISDRIIPTTDTPGANEAGVPAFIALLYRDWLLPEEQVSFRGGIAELESQARERQQKRFVDCAPSQQDELIKQWDDQAFASANAAAMPFFRTLKQLIVTGYYTSEIGQETELKTVLDAGENEASGPIMMTPPLRL